MVPLWGPGTSVMFQDWEGRLYSVDYLTGAEIYKVGGDIGTHTNAAAVYSPGHNSVIAMGMKHYTTGRCNPYPAPGILPSCWTWPGGRGFIRAYNASSGHRFWETETGEPPASASISALNSPAFHTRLIVTMGHNCFLGSPSQIWGLDPGSGHIRWMKEGPTLWTGFCAGDKEGADIRRAMGGREKCNPNSWSAPVADSTGDLYVGNQVGQLMRYGLEVHSSSTRPDLLSTLTTGVAFQDSAIAFGAGVMAVTTCTSLVVFQTMDGFANETWSISHDDYSPITNQVQGEDISHDISEESHGDISVTPKVDSDDIWSNDEPVYDPNIDGHTYNRRMAKDITY
jgi:outer membrane protein assembly factor BamB